MSEKIYACLLRLFPSGFREAYGEEALQLFRDRTRDKRGFFRTLRLWLDLLVDLAISIPREYRHVRPALIGALTPQRLCGTPCFQILESESLRPEALLSAALLSLVAFVAIPALIGHGGNRPIGPSLVRPQHPNGAHRFAFALLPRQPAGDTKEETEAYTRAMISVADEGVKLDAAQRHRVVDAVIQNLKKHYIDPNIARTMTEALLAHEKNGDDDTVTNGRALAGLLTRQMRDVSHDMHLEVVYSQSPLPDLLTEPSPEDLERYRKALEQENCTFKKVETLPHNIGYLKLNAFPDPSICQATARAAMASLNQVDAIIFDLRDNHGGEPAMVALMAAYLFDHPEYWYNPRENTTEQSWTLSPVPGNRLADKPAYVLTSARTFSGAEQFCYDLKMLKRATLVGETTGGAAHAGVFHRIDDHFGMGITEVRAINPYSKTDWAETGVEPDVKVKAADALATAEKLAESKLQKK